MNGRSSHSILRALAVLACFAAMVSFPADRSEATPPQYESAQIHPLVMTGDLVLAVNTPDARLSIFSWVGDELRLRDEVKVGLEPVSVRAKSGTEAWVVNHLSDDISIVDLDEATVVHTLLLGDEPTDVAFVLDPIEDDGSLWAVISLSQEDRVVIHDAEWPYSEIASVDIQGSDPRALVPTPDRSAVWVAVFESGNNTTLAPRTLVHLPQSPWGGSLPPFDPPLNPDLPSELLPDNGVIVRSAGASWLDEQGGDWTSLITWDLFDIDLVRIDIGPVPTVSRSITGVGTLIGDLAVDPRDDSIWSVNIESFSEIFFEPKLTGEFVRNRVSRVDVSGAVEPIELNGHISFGPPGAPNGPSAEGLREQSVAIPTEILYSEITGQPEFFVTGMGGSRIAVLDADTRSVTRRLPVTEGATGLIELSGRGELLILDRFTNELAFVDPLTGETGERVSIGRSGWDPTPSDIRNGRRFLYTASKSAHGTSACASCHPSANMDNIAWDLGDPTGELSQLDPALNQGVSVAPFHPLKGPMTTQTLRGILDTGRFHWRGDRADFTRFNPAFVSLLGGDSLTTAEMSDFESFILSLDYPPNPFRTLLDDMTPTGNGGDPDIGLGVFDNGDFCSGCHAFPLGTNGIVFPIEQIPGFGNQPMKIPQLRNLYEKSGFGDLNGPNKRGFGFLHDGTDHDIEAFVAEPIFNLDPDEQRNLAAFLFNFGTETHPATGATVTFDAASLSDADLLERFGDMETATEFGAVDLVVHGRVANEERGWIWIAGDTYQSDRADDLWSTGDLASAISNGSALTLTCVPPGEGVRMGVDRDLDGALDHDEIDVGSDPADPDATPSAIDSSPSTPSTGLARLVSVFPSPFFEQTSIEFYVPRNQHAEVNVFDVKGRRVASLANAGFEPGRQVVKWSGNDDFGRLVPAGTYFIELRIDQVRDARKVIRFE